MNLQEQLRDAISAAVSYCIRNDFAFGSYEDQITKAVLDVLEKQEPVAWAATDETCRIVEALGFNQSRRFDTPLYLLPGAQPAPSVPVDVIADYLVSISAHIAHMDDAKAQAEIGELLKMLAVAPKPEAKP